MSVNPWKVETVQAFYFLNCPECAFKTKTEDMFKMHAFSNHPLSCILFEKSTETFIKEEQMSETELEHMAKEDPKTLEELMSSEFGPPEPLNNNKMTLGNQFDHSYAAEKVDTTLTTYRSFYQLKKLYTQKTMILMFPVSIPIA